MTITTAITALGWVGAVAGITAYAMVSQGRWNAGSYAFQLVNLGGAVALFLVAAAGGIWPSAAATVAWMVIGVHSTVTIARRRAAANADAAAASRAGHAAPPSTDIPSTAAPVLATTSPAVAPA
jgi:hypothetical protein